MEAAAKGDGQRERRSNRLLRQREQTEIDLVAGRRAQHRRCDQRHPDGPGGALEAPRPIETADGGSMRSVAAAARPRPWLVQRWRSAAVDAGEREDRLGEAGGLRQQAPATPCGSRSRCTSTIHRDSCRRSERARAVPRTAASSYSERHRGEFAGDGDLAGGQGVLDRRCCRARP